MKLLLCAATEFEIAPSINFIHQHGLSNVEILITGVGLTAATYSLTKTIYQNRPDFIFQAGIAGCLDLHLPLTKTVLVANETIGDLGVEERNNFQTLFNMGFLQKDEFPWKNGKLCNDLSSLQSTGLTIVDGVTVNEISTNISRINFYKNQLSASIESMEGAALHFVALQENIRFLQIRSLSNFTGERDKNKWMIKEAIASLNIELQRILLKF